MSDGKVKPWPEKPPEWQRIGSYADYERARADAAMSRLRVAMRQMRHAPRCASVPVSRDEPQVACNCGYAEALAAIGPLPHTLPEEAKGE